MSNNLHNLFDNIGQLILINPLMAFVVVFFGGVGVGFTPCVYPVIPITLGYIGATSTGKWWRGLTLSLVYVFGMALIYAVLGVFAVLTGQIFGKISSSPWTYFVVASVCFWLGLSMLDVFKLPSISLPRFLTLTKKNGYWGAFLIGIFSGLIVGPCTAPVLAAVLIYVASTQNILYGFLLLFTFGYGVGFLMILLGTFSGLLSSLPKSGAWLLKVKKGFGLLLIFTAGYLLSKMGGLFR